MTKTGKMTVQAASRVYSATAKNGNGSVGKNTFGARVMSAAMLQVSPAGTQGGSKVAAGKPKK